MRFTSPSKLLIATETLVLSTDQDLSPAIA